MNAWKAILAAFVIFCAGAVSGGLLVKLYSHHSPPQRPPHPRSAGGMERGPGWDQRASFLRKLQDQLQLNGEQSKRIEVILNESQDRVKKLWDRVAPEAREEIKRSQELIRQELTPEQQVKFETLLRERKSHRGEDARDPKKRGEPPPPSPPDQAEKSNSPPPNQPP